MMIVYTSPNCPACESLKKSMTLKNIEFTTIDISTNTDAKLRLVEMGFRTVPQVYNPATGEFISKAELGL